MPNREPMTALWRLASAKMMLGDLPPSSREIFLTLLAAARITSLPTSVEPVNAILSTSSEAARRPPVAAAVPGMTLTTPAGGGRAPRGGRGRAGDDVADAGGGARLVEDAAQLVGRAGRVGGGLHDDRAADGQGRRRLPRHQEQGEVPGRDDPDA